MLIILGVGSPLSFSMNLGDLMALLSGILFAFGAMRVRQAPETSVFEQVLAFFLYGSLAALALSLPKYLKRRVVLRAIGFQLGARVSLSQHPTAVVLLRYRTPGRARAGASDHWLSQ